MPESFAAEMTSGKRWIEIDYDKMMQKEYGASFSETKGARKERRPTRLPQGRLRPGGGGRNRTRPWRPETHYRAEVDVDKFAPEEPEARRAFEKAMGNVRADKIPTEV